MNNETFGSIGIGIYIFCFSSLLVLVSLPFLVGIKIFLLLWDLVFKFRKILS